MPNQRIRMKLAISPDDYLAFYQGQARNVLARAEDGRSVQFPAGALRQYITRDGIRGLFELEFDHNHRFVALFKVRDL